MNVLVIGGGPGGSTAAAVLARNGVDVTLVEREAFPRPHVGESLQPALFSLLREHLGLDDVFAKAGFARKYGAVYTWGESREPWSVLFDDRLEGLELTEEELLAGDFEHAWQVDRARFDAILLDAARDNGVDVRQPAEVTGIELDADRVVAVQTSEGTFQPDVLLDASGQRCVLGRQLGTVRLLSDLRSMASWAYYEGAGGVEAPLGRHVQVVVTTEDGWVWFIPVSPTRTSVGVVYRRRERLSEADYDAAVARAGLPLDGATRGELHFGRDWSFTNSRLAGPNWMLTGDAACFVDPILSGGVDFAVRSACRAAFAVLRHGTGEDWGPLADAYASTYQREYKAYLRLARYWYGNNRSVEGLFWEAHREIAPQATATPLRAFVYLTTGNYAAERHLKVFAEWQEKKMFRKLGVDRSALEKARRQRSRG